MRLSRPGGPLLCGRGQCLWVHMRRGDSQFELSASAPLWQRFWLSDWALRQMQWCVWWRTLPQWYLPLRLGTAVSKCFIVEFVHVLYLVSFADRVYTRILAFKEDGSYQWTNTKDVQTRQNVVMHVVVSVPCHFSRRGISPLKLWRMSRCNILRERVFLSSPRTTPLLVNSVSRHSRRTPLASSWPRQTQLLVHNVRIHSFVFFSPSTKSLW